MRKSLLHLAGIIVGAFALSGVGFQHPVDAQATAPQSHSNLSAYIEQYSVPVDEGSVDLQQYTMLRNTELSN